MLNGHTKPVAQPLGAGMSHIRVWMQGSSTEIWYWIGNFRLPRDSVIVHSKLSASHGANVPLKEEYTLKNTNSVHTFTHPFVVSKTCMTFSSYVEQQKMLKKNFFLFIQ